jgi:hypothetical protein
MVPPMAVPLMGDVVTEPPSLNAVDPVITPVIEPSRACFHFEMTGTPRGGAVDVDLVEIVREESLLDSDGTPPKTNRLLVTLLMIRL